MINIYSDNDDVIFETCLGERLNPYIHEVNLYNIHCCSFTYITKSWILEADRRPYKTYVDVLGIYDSF